MNKKELRKALTKLAKSMGGTLKWHDSDPQEICFAVVGKDFGWDGQSSEKFTDKSESMIDQWIPEGANVDGTAANGKDDLECAIRYYFGEEQPSRYNPPTRGIRK